LAVVRQELTVSEIAAKYKVHSVNVAKWKSQLIERGCCIIDPNDKLFNITQQCELLNAPRSPFYYEPIPMTAAELALMEKFERFHFEYPFYGSRRMAVEFEMSRTKALRLVRDMYIVATCPKKRTTIPNHEHTNFPYLLRGIVPQRPNHIWSTDITYVALFKGFVYLTAIIDWYSRMILLW
jgi:putative transposase